ncbi:MAG TPA: F0F1 ATP synthase subunit alpha, partial [Deltaproteobacteria bacterium]|nr:F0F1 ATP synthase subunit alpha [Deltaproteobacteria bacterium]
VDQVLSIFAATNGYLDEMPINALSKFETEFLTFIQTNKAELRKSIEEANKIDDAAETELKSVLDEFVQAFSA